MMELLALTITCRWWMLLLLITIGSAIFAGSKTESGGYFPDNGPTVMWIIFNLIMWLIYFIVAYEKNNGC